MPGRHVTDRQKRLFMTLKKTHTIDVAAAKAKLGNFMRTLALPDAVEQWSLTSLREKLIKIGAKIVRHGRYVTFQMAEIVIPRDLFADILRRIDRLRPPPAPA